MNTKEVIDIRKWIEFLKSQRDDHFVYESLTKDYNKVILLLKRLDKKSKRGERYEAMWRELSKRYGNYFYTFDVRIANDIEYKYVDEIMDIIKQKYFPKEELSVHKS